MIKTRIRAALAALVTLVVLFATPAFAQDKGSITGHVADKKTGHAIPFASVTVAEVKRGGLTDSEGQYIIGGLLPGTYTVNIQFLGYKPVSQANVTVTGGKATTVNFSMEEIVVREEKAIEVSAERRLVEVKQGTTVRSVTANEIRNLPVATLGDVLQQQAGVSVENDQVHVRGGRADETVFIINGVANRDLVTGQSTAGALNARSVAEVNVATGAYDVRYGNALSGVVEVKLRDGGEKFAGGLTLGSGSYGSRNFQGVFGGPDPVFGPLMRVLGAKGTISSIVDFSGAFYATRFPNVTDLPDKYRLHSSYEDGFFGRRFNYGTFWSPSEDNKWAFRYGLSWKPSTRDKWTFNWSKRFAIDQGFSRTLINATGDAGDPAYPWQWSQRIEHTNTFFEDNVQGSVDWRRTLGSTGYTDFQVSRYFFAQRQDVEGKYWQDYVEPFPGDIVSDYFYNSGDDNMWQDRRTQSWAMTGSWVQRIRHQEFEAGFEHQFQDVQYATIEDPWVYDPNGLGRSHDLWKVHPWVGNFYLRDRLEFEGFTANIGLRWDYWFPGREAENALADTSNRNVTADTREEFMQDTYSFFGRRFKLKPVLRVVVAHPITENSSFFFNIGGFTQNPSYKYVYSKLTSISSESYPLLGNPNLNPQVSVNYEVGGKWQYTPTAAVNATFFVKDVYDYPTAAQFTPTEGTDLTPILVYVNGQFARSKGFELQLEKRRSHYWSGRIAYTFSQTKGKSSDPNAQRVLAEGGGDAKETPLSESFVSWNRPHKLNGNFDLRFDKETPHALRWARQSGMSATLNGQTGRPYSKLQLINGQGVQVGEVNAYNIPFQSTFDLKLNHYFLPGGRKLDFSVQILNLFDMRVWNRVDPYTGEPYRAGVGTLDPTLPKYYDTDASGEKVFSETKYQYALDQYANDPSNRGAPRQVRFQVDYDF